MVIYSLPEEASVSAMPQIRSETPFTDLPKHLQLRKQPKQKRSREAFERILDAAIDLAAEEGSSSVNTNAIAERSGMDVASVYRTFPNKESILYWAADRWLSRVRSACEEMDREEYIDLPWREFLAEFGDLISSFPEHHKAYLPLQPLWASSPEFQSLLAKHYEYLVQFYVRHFRRLGASISDSQLENLAYYLVVSSDMIRDVGPSLTKEREEAMYELDYETWMAHLSKIMPPAAPY